MAPGFDHDSMALQVCGMSAGTQGYLRCSRLKDLRPLCRQSPACRASGLAQLRVDRSKLGDGLHPTRAGVAPSFQSSRPLNLCKRVSRS